MSKGLIQTPRGTKDILPEEQKFWFYIFDVVRDAFGIFGAKRIETPIIEFSEIYAKAIGISTDIVDKELFEVKRTSNRALDSEGDENDKIMVLRPEYTAGIARAYLQNGMNTWPQPVKLWYFGPGFRYDRPQAGRYRIFNQFGLEVIGDDSPLTDTASILSAWQILKKLGLEKSILVDINSIGDANCREKIKKKLLDYFQNFLPHLCPDCNRRYVENPLRILDCKNAKCQKIIAGAPQIIDLLCDACKTHFKQLLESLDSLQIPYNLNPRLVRGLDYYTRTVFEIYLKDDTSRQRTLIGGGRYDDLLKLMGGEQTPAVGWAAGVERIIEVIREEGIDVKDIPSSDVCLVQIGEKARKVALSLLVSLENEGFRSSLIIGKESLKGQLRSAGKLGCTISLIIGQRETIDKTIILKDMDNGSQETISQKGLIEVLRKKLK